MGPSDRLARRAERDRLLRRRRRVAVAGLLAVAVAIVLAVVAFSGDSEDRRQTRRGGDAGSAGAAPAKRPQSPGGARLPAAVPSRAPGAHKAPNEPVPILMYHVIGTPGPTTPNPELWVTATDFRAEMRALSDRGYHGVTLQQVHDAWHKGGLLPAKPIVVSFDDGSSGQHDVGLPTLRGLGWPGVLNLKLGNLRDIKPWRVRSLISAGWEIASHTIDHSDLTAVGDEKMRSELEDSRARLRREFGVPANFFCYPAGRFDDRVVAAVQRAGYLGATTTQEGFARRQDPFTLARVRVNGSDGPDGVVRKLDELSANPAAPPGAAAPGSG